MYDDYDDLDYYDDYGGDFDDSLDDDLMDYDNQLDDLRYEMEDADDMYSRELSEIDEYWDRENQYIMSNDVYTAEEKRTIIEQHELERYSQKESARTKHEMDLDYFRMEREQIEDERQQAIEDREMEQMMREEERQSRQQAKRDYAYQPPQQKPSFISRALTSVAIYHFLKKLFK